MTSKTSVISIFVLLLAACCYSVPIAPRGETSTELSDVTTQTQLIDNKHERSTKTDELKPEEIKQTGDVNEFLYSTLETNTEFDHRVIRPSDDQSKPKETRELGTTKDEVEPKQTSSPSSSVETFGRTTGLLPEEKPILEKDEKKTIGTTEQRQKKSMKVDTEGTEEVTGEPVLKEEEPMKPTEQRQKKSMKVDTEGTEDVTGEPVGQGEEKPTLKDVGNTKTTNDKRGSPNDDTDSSDEDSTSSKREIAGDDSNENETERKTTTGGAKDQSSEELITQSTMIMESVPTNGEFVTKENGEKQPVIEETKSNN